MTFAGVTIPGVYQINVVVPADLAGGDHVVQAEIGGTRTQNNAFLAVGRRRKPSASRFPTDWIPGLCMARPGQGPGLRHLSLGP